MTGNGGSPLRVCQIVVSNLNTTLWRSKNGWDQVSTGKVCQENFKEISRPMFPEASYFAYRLKLNIINSSSVYSVATTQIHNSCTIHQPISGQSIHIFGMSPKGGIHPMEAHLKFVTATLLDSRQFLDNMRPPKACHKPTRMPDKALQMIR